jgi:hypothetical protein
MPSVILLTAVLLNVVARIF